MNNRLVFIDTSGFLALIDDKLELFKKVSNLFEDFFSTGKKVITTDYVMDEVFTWMRCKQKLPIQDILEFGKGLRMSDVQIVGITDEIFYDAFAIMVEFKDQYFSFTDCISFTVMKSMKIKDVVTTDKHFAIAGYNNLVQ